MRSHANLIVLGKTASAFLAFIYGWLFAALWAALYNFFAVHSAGEWEST